MKALDLMDMISSQLQRHGSELEICIAGLETFEDISSVRFVSGAAGTGNAIAIFTQRPLVPHFEPLTDKVQ